jgi:hypothetical protein
LEHPDYYLLDKALVELSSSLSIRVQAKIRADHHQSAMLAPIQTNSSFHVAGQVKIDPMPLMQE